VSRKAHELALRHGPSACVSMTVMMALADLKAALWHERS
jgi:hypothetical protein